MESLQKTATFADISGEINKGKTENIRQMWNLFYLAIHHSFLTDKDSPFKDYLGFKPLNI